MVLLSDIYSVLNNVKKVTVWKDTKATVDMGAKEKYEVVSVSSIYGYGNSGLHIRVREI